MAAFLESGEAAMIQHRQRLIPRDIRLDRRGMQILTSIDFSRPTFLTDSTAGFRDGVYG